MKKHRMCEDLIGSKKIEFYKEGGKFTVKTIDNGYGFAPTKEVTLYYGTDYHTAEYTYSVNWNLLVENYRRGV